MRWSCAFCVLYLLNVSALHYRFTFFQKPSIHFFQYEKYLTKCMKIDDIFRASILRFLQHFPLLRTIICMNKLNVNVESIREREKQLYISSNHISGLFLEGKTVIKNLASEDFLRILRTSYFWQQFHFSKKSENKIFSPCTSQKRTKANTFYFFHFSNSINPLLLEPACPTNFQYQNETTCWANETLSLH